MILDTHKASYAFGCSEAMYLFLMSKMLNNTHDLNTIAKNKQYINEEGVVPKEVCDKLVEVTVTSLPDAATIAYARAQAKALMAIWPAGIKPGTASSWRGTLNQNTLRLIQFSSLFGKYNMNTVTQAAKDYLTMFTDQTYMKTLPNFIIPEEILEESYDKVTSVPTSLLEQYIILNSESNGTNQ